MEGAQAGFGVSILDAAHCGAVDAGSVGEDELGDAHPGPQVTNPSPNLYANVEIHPEINDFRSEWWQCGVNATSWRFGYPMKVVWIDPNLREETRLHQRGGKQTFITWTICALHYRLPRTWNMREGGCRSSGEQL